MSKELPSELRIVLDNALREAADNVAQRQVDDDRQRASRGAPRGGRGQRGRTPQREPGEVEGEQDVVRIEVPPPQAEAEVRWHQMFPISRQNQRQQQNKQVYVV